MAAVGVAGTVLWQAPPDGAASNAGAPRVRAPAATKLVVRSAPARCRCVWVALDGAHQIAKVDITRRKVLIRRPVPGAPHNLTISPSGKSVATALWTQGGGVTVKRGRRTRTTHLGGAPHDVKIGGGRIVVTNQTEARLDLLSNKGTFRRSIGLKADPHDVALRWNGRQAWVSLEGSDDLAVVGFKSGRVHYVSTNRSPHDLLFAPGGKLWVTDWHGAVHVLSRRGRRLKTIPIGVEAHHLAFTPNGGEVWVTDHAAHRIFVINAKTYSVRKRFKVKGAPHHVAITSDGDRAVVADHERGVVIVYNVHKLQRMYVIRVGAAPHGIWAVP